MSRIILNKRVVDRYVESYILMLEAARSLFVEYTKAFPDKDDWLGVDGWNGQSGDIEFTGDSIEYSCYTYYRGDGNGYSLSLPISALWNELFIENVVKERKEELELKERSAKNKMKEHEEYQKIYDLRLYNEIKTKYNL